VGPERRLVQRNLTPSSAYVCDTGPDQRIGLLRECGEVEDAREDLRREDGDRSDRVAAREHGEDQTLHGIKVLVDCGKGCRVRLRRFQGRLELVQLAIEVVEDV
jgi:hypothetical protein